ncbi:perlucin-like protein [Mytilus galloprovincialis]|uniref:perlucin-like protein n=1 Tax=Mytilus galloprovincialis TaxID=29158 RepID=UPI003F7CA281
MPTICLKSHSPDLTKYRRQQPRTTTGLRALDLGQALCIVEGLNFFAGIDEDFLTLAYEPEAAAIYCKEATVQRKEGTEECSLQSFDAGHQFLVLDCGEKTCEPGWLKYKGSCYFFSKNSNTWINAERECRQKSSNLVKIESASENIWIKRQAEVTHDQRWIGAREVHGQWEWVSDLSPLTFTSWAVNEPNNAKENCAHIHKVISYNWNDIKCSKRFNFICEKSTG